MPGPDCKPWRTTTAICCKLPIQISSYAEKTLQIPYMCRKDAERANVCGTIAHLVSLPSIDVKPFNQLSSFQPRHLKHLCQSCQGLECDCQEVCTNVCGFLGIAPGFAERQLGQNKERMQQTLTRGILWYGLLCYSI